jgi:hypothetical protein
MIILICPLGGIVTLICNQLLGVAILVIFLLYAMLMAQAEYKQYQQTGQGSDNC